jgi:hypothetical protein
MAKSKIGFHVGPGGNKNGLGAWERALNGAGQAFGMKAADTYGPIHEAVQIGCEHGIQNWLGFRFTRAAGRVSREVPDYDVPPWDDAPRLCQEVLDKLPPEFDKFVWLEIINEPRDENSGSDTMFADMNATDYLGEWCLAAAQFLNERGYKFMGPSFNSGRPGREGHPLRDAVTQYSQPGMLKYLRYCAENPEKAALSVHEYSWSTWKEGQTAPDWYPGLWGRFEAAIAAADLAGIPRTFHIFVTEFGFAHQEAPSGGSARPFLDARNHMLARWPQVKYDAGWTLQSGWKQVDNHVNSWMQYEATKEFDEGEQPARTHEVFGGTLPGAEPIKPIQPEPTDFEEEPAGSLAYQMLTFKNSVDSFDNMLPGRQFSGTWTIQNTGTRTWSGDFSIAYLDQATDNTLDAVRDLMSADSSYTLRELTGRERVNPGETVTIRLDLVAPQQPGVYAFHWQLQSAAGQAFGGVRWLRIGVAGQPSILPTPEPVPVARAIQFGMNINPNDGHGLDLERLRGLGWVRFVFWASREGRSPEDAYHARYRHIIQSYANTGTKSLLILHQDTEWGNGPWQGGGWQEYANVFAKACGRVARACSEFSDKVAYQIWNEEDSGFGADAANTNPSAIGIAPEHYAIVLDRAVKAIREADPQATIVMGGLKTGPENAVNYLNHVRAKLGGEIPVDALAYHPYGRFVHNDPFYNRQFGTLPDALGTFKQAFPQLPLWITEMGVADDNPIGPEHYKKIADYKREIFNEIADNHDDHVPVFIWFAWSDLMRNAGITTIDGRMKDHIGNAFREMVARGQVEPSTVSFAPSGMEEANSEFLRFNTTLKDHNAVPAGSTFTNRWVFKNTGNTTWSDGYRLVYTPVPHANSDPMLAKTSFPLAEVAQPLPAGPGDEVEIKLDMTAPTQFGRRTVSRWELRDPGDDPFGHIFAEITVVPAPTAGTNVLTPGMTFVRDQTIADGTQLVAGSDFKKQWLVRNTGSRQWGSGFRLIYVQGDLQMARGVAAHVVPEAKPGDEVTLSIPMTAPPPSGSLPTAYSTLWKLQDDRGNIFGDPIWAKIVSLPAISESTGQATPLVRLLNDPSAWYSQLDPSWAGDTLGHGQQSIGSWGCLMTCMAMALTAFGTRFNPAELNQHLKTIGDEGFVSSSVQFVAPFHVGGLSFRRNVRSWEDSDIPDSTWTGEDPIQRIDQALAEGNIVVAQVDTKPNNGLYDSNMEQHWVVIVKRTPGGDDYLILDPIIRADAVQTQPLSLMTKYGNRVPSETHEVNLRNAIKSTLVYHKPGG